MRPKKHPLKLSYDRGAGRESTVVSRRYNDDNDVEDYGDDDDMDDSSGADEPTAAASDDEDTDDASEAESTSEDFSGGQVTEIKERMYLDKLASLKSQLNQLKQGVHPDYNKRLKRLEYQHKERVHVAEVWHEYECGVIETEYEREQQQLEAELEERRGELRDSLLAGLHAKQRLIEAEGASMDINGDSVDLKPLPTRKLRRRPNDPAPVQDKRRKPAVPTPSYLLDEADVDEDLATISRGKPPPSTHQQQQQQQHHTLKKSSFLPEGVSSSGGGGGGGAVTRTSPSCSVSPRTEPAVSPPSLNSLSSVSGGLAINQARIEDNKLFFERKWFHRGQPVYVDMSGAGGDPACFSAVITAIQSDVVWVRNIADNSKSRIYLNQLQCNKCTIKRRAS